MTRNRIRLLAAGICLFLIPACNPPAPAPDGTPGGGLPADTPSVTAEVADTPTVEVPPPAGWVYAVVLVPEGEALEIHGGSGYESPVIGTVSWDFAPLVSTGTVDRIGTETWVEAYLPEGGTGWFDREFLTGYIPPEEFCAQVPAAELFGSLYEALRTNDGRLLTPIVSPVHGLTVTYINNGYPKAYDPAQAGMVFGSPDIVDWGLGPGSGLPVEGTFEDLVRPDLLAVFGSAYETRCNAITLGGASYTVTWPSLWKNINFYSVYKPGTPGTELDWMTWLVGIEAAEGEFYLFSLSRYNWEP